MRKETGTLEGRQAIVSAVWKRAGCRGDEISSGAAAEQQRSSRSGGPRERAGRRRWTQSSAVFMGNGASSCRGRGSGRLIFSFGRHHLWLWASGHPRLQSSSRWRGNLRRRLPIKSERPTEALHCWLWSGPERGQLCIFTGAAEPAGAQGRALEI